MIWLEYIVLLLLWTCCNSQNERGKSCSGSPTIENGDITTLSQKQYPPGSSVEFRCLRDYVMEGDSRSFCDNGNWTKVPVCLEPCVISLAELERQNIIVILWSNEDEVPTLYLPRGDSIELSCKPGLVLATDRSQSVFEFQCRGRPIVYPECTDSSCGNPPPIANGSAVNDTQGKYLPGSKVEYRCNEGFDIIGKFSTCNNGSWISVPTCKEIICESGNIENGYVTSLEDVYKEGDELQFECNSGYNPADGSVAVCSRNGWNARLLCRDAEGKCGRPPVIQNGDILETVQAVNPPGTTLRYVCQQFYLMEGSAEVRCDNGLWTETPTCLEPCTITEEDMARNNIQLKWTNVPKLYSTSGGFTEFVCIQDYQPDPSSPPFRAQCRHGRLEYPRCIYLKPCTVSDEDMVRNNIQLKWLNAPKLDVVSGDAAEFMCRQNYQESPLSPPFRAQCRDGRVAYPRCIQVF